jgi:hypothetical protein
LADTQIEGPHLVRGEGLFYLPRHPVRIYMSPEGETRNKFQKEYQDIRAKGFRRSE